MGNAWSRWSVIQPSVELTLQGDIFSLRSEVDGRIYTIVLRQQELEVVDIQTLANNDTSRFFRIQSCANGGNDTDFIVIAYNTTMRMWYGHPNSLEIQEYPIPEEYQNPTQQQYRFRFERVDQIGSPEPIYRIRNLAIGFVQEDNVLTFDPASGQASFTTAADNPRQKWRLYRF